MYEQCVLEDLPVGSIWCVNNGRSPSCLKKYLKVNEGGRRSSVQLRYINNVLVEDNPFLFAHDEFTSHIGSQKVLILKHPYEHAIQHPNLQVSAAYEALKILDTLPAIPEV